MQVEQLSDVSPDGNWLIVRVLWCLWGDDSGSVDKGQPEIGGCFQTG
jgi:hypothetical protein